VAIVSCQAPKAMAIVAINQEVLDLFNHLLHDLYFTIPAAGFRPSEGSLSIDFIDKDFCIHQDRIAKYRLGIQSVLEVETEGSLESLPGTEVELNEIQFHKNHEKKVTLECVHPFRLISKVRELRLSLDQLQ
jgi:hypothetical protein